MTRTAHRRERGCNHLDQQATGGYPEGNERAQGSALCQIWQEHQFGSRLIHRAARSVRRHLVPRIVTAASMWNVSSSSSLVIARTCRTEMYALIMLTRPLTLTSRTTPARRASCGCRQPGHRRVGTCHDQGRNGDIRQHSQITMHRAKTSPMNCGAIIIWIDSLKWSTDAEHVWRLFALCRGRTADCYNSQSSYRWLMKAGIQTYRHIFP